MTDFNKMFAILFHWKQDLTRKIWDYITSNESKTENYYFYIMIVVEVLTSVYKGQISNDTLTSVKFFHLRYHYLFYPYIRHSLFCFFVVVFFPLSQNENNRISDTKQQNYSSYCCQSFSVPIDKLFIHF